MNRNLLIFCILFFSTIIKAQPPQLWSHTLDLNEHENIYDCTADFQENIYLTTEWKLDTYQVVKYDKLGNLKWNIPVKGAYWIKTDGNGNVYTTGISSLGGINSMVSTKIDSMGNIKWQKVYGNSNYDNFSRNLAVSNSGDFFITGNGGDSNSNNNIFTGRHNNNDGNFDWLHKETQVSGLASGTQAQGMDIEIGEDGNVYVAGIDRNSSFTLGADMTLLCYSTTGNLIWAKRYNTNQGYGTFFTTALSVTADAIYVIGNGGVFYSQPSEGQIVKYDHNGQLLWHKSFGFTGYENTTVYNLSINKNEDLVIGGTLQDVDTTGFFMGMPITETYTYSMLMSTDSSGVIQWQHFFPNAESADVPVDTFGNIYFSYFAKNTADIIVNKFNSTGDSIWQITAPSFLHVSQPFAGRNTIVFGDDDIAIAGGELNATIDIWIARYSQSTISNHTIENAKIEVYPIPANNTLFIHNSPEPKLYFEIYSLKGEKVKQIAADNLEQKSIDVSDLSTNVYWLRGMNDEKVVFMKKILIVRN